MRSPFLRWYSVGEIAIRIDPSWRNNYESQIVGGDYCIWCCDMPPARCANASSVLLSSATPTEACMYRKARYQQKSWFQSPLSVVIALPGIALATALYMGGRSYQN